MKVLNNTLLAIGQITLVGLVVGLVVITAFLVGVMFVSATAESQNRPVIVRTISMKSKLKVRKTQSIPENLQPTWSPQ